MENLVRLKESMAILKLDSFYDNIVNNYSEIADEDVIKMLFDLSNREIENRNNKAKTQMLKTSGFPSVKRVEEFDFDFNTQINKNKYLSLMDLTFVDRSENVLFVGTPGVGKTHLSIALGVMSAESRISTYFIKCQKLLASLKLAFDENRLEERLKHYAKYKVLIIDEIGFLPIKENESKLLFQLIDKRYESKSTIITTNVMFENWYSIFNDPTIANAILDRLLHHSYIFKITGDSYRMKSLIENKEEREN